MGRIVFTNGCFDVLHAGHVDFLERASVLGDRLVVGINSDESVSRIKGQGRPINGQEARRKVLLGLRFVDEVHIFSENTPERLVSELQPDVIVKGGDWKPEEIVGSETVLRKGGQVVSLPLFGEFSTTSMVAKMTAREAADGPENSVPGISRSMSEHIEVMERLLSGSAAAIERTGSRISEALAAGNKVLLCGNGGSAADAQHIAAELVGRFEAERRGLPAIALTTDTSALTAISNDYGFDSVYARQVEALGAPGDVLVCISTSGNSRNIIGAAMKAREIGCGTIALTGATGAKLASVCDDSILVPSSRTARIQEGHILIGHLWCESVERRFTGGS